MPEEDRGWPRYAGGRQEAAVNMTDKNGEPAVDVIIPVYNGYEDLQKCVMSLKRHTCLERHRLLLINDCSPDERIRPYLDALAGDGIVVLHNERNLGFSGSVNRGMRFLAPHDVILLNSDTIVTKNWIEKITACAYRDETIGTVTPLSNSATLCSVPVMCQDNDLPEHLTVDEYAALIERCSLRRYPRITVAVGFCMYIKRCLIEDIGLFDAETFGRGYGEENDFCNRAEQAGYRHVMCDDTFIYHKGTASFDTAQKKALVEAHTAVLEERYPEQMRRNHLYCMENPDQEIRDNINLYTKLHNGKKNLLYCLHLDFRDQAFNNIGGTQIHVRELMEEFRAEYNIFVLARDGEYLCVTAYTDQESVLLKFEIGKPPQFPVFHDRNLRRIYEQVLMIFEIDLIHVHHTQDLSLEIYDAAKKLGIPLIATIHDYYYACPTILLLDADGRFCAKAAGSRGPEDDRRLCGEAGREESGGGRGENGQEEQDGSDRACGEVCRKESGGEEESCGCCRRCLWERKGIVPQLDYLRIWRTENEKALQTCQKLIFPSRSARDIMLQYFPKLSKRDSLCQVIEHGEDKIQRKVCHVPAPQTFVKHANLKIKLDRVVGADQGLNDIKGWAYLAGVPNEETEILVELTDQAGHRDCFRAPKTARPDIVDAFGDPDALMCGIDLRVSTEVLSDGPVKIRVFVEHAGKLYTDGQSVKGEYRSRFGENGRLNVAFLGGMVPQKGSRMAKKLIQMDQKSINWFVLGAIGDKDILEIHQDNCFFSSTYKKEELPQLLTDNHIDVACILPVCPETFCYTVSEAWMNGIPVLGTDIGAVGERIRAAGAGWLVSPDAQPEEVLELLHRIGSDPLELAEKKRIVGALPQKNVAQMCREYRALYAEFLKEKTRREKAGGMDFDFMFQALALGDPSVGGHGGIACLNRLRQENEALKSSIEVMKGTSSYRLARKIADMNLPFKEQLKKQVRKLRGMPENR